MPRIYASSEGTSFAVLEGMAMKKPIVTTDVGGIKEIGINRCISSQAPSAQE